MIECFSAESTVSLTIFEVQCGDGNSQAEDTTLENLHINTILIRLLNRKDR